MSTEIIVDAAESVQLTEASSSLTAVIAKVDNELTELTQHLEYQFNEDEPDSSNLQPSSASPASASEKSPEGTAPVSEPQEKDHMSHDRPSEEYPAAANSESTSNAQDVFSNKLFSLISSLQQRDGKEETDEWENDDDAGYVSVTLTEEEFFEFEDRNAERLYKEKAAAKEQKDRNDDEDGSNAANLDSVHSTIEDSADKDHSPTFAPLPKTIEPIDKPAYVPIHKDPFAVFDNTAMSVANRRQSINERRRSEIMGQHRFQGTDGMHCFFNLKVIFEPYKTGFEESKDLKHPKGTIIAGRYEVQDVLGSAAFSTALQCVDQAAEEDEAQFVCLKVIKNNKDFFDQSLDEIKLLQYINSRGDPDEHNVLRLIDFFYCKEHLFIVSELLKENLYEFGRFIRENNMEVYYTLARLKRISKQVLEALSFIHSLRLIHCDVKPENIVIRSFSRCEVKLIDFGSSCFTSDHLTTYIQSRSYRAPEVIIGHPYDSRIDVWSVGAVIAELYTGYVLFQNDSVQTMLSRITGILGNFPEHVLQEGRESSKYFTLSNCVYERDESGQYHLIFPKRTTLQSRLHFDATASMTRDEELFVDFIRTTLLLDPRKRPTAYEALQHPWLADADTVEFEPYIIGQTAAPVDNNAPGSRASGYYPPVPTYDDEEEDEDEDEFEDIEGDLDEELDLEEEAVLRQMGYSKSIYGDGDEEDEDVDLDADQLEEISRRLAAYDVDIAAEEEVEALAAMAAQQSEESATEEPGAESSPIDEK